MVTENEAKPCDCPAASDEWPHTEADHRADCGYIRYGRTDEACGGCWGCLAAQATYYASKENDKTPPLEARGSSPRGDVGEEVTGSERPAGRRASSPHIETPGRVPDLQARVAELEAQLEARARDLGAFTQSAVSRTKALEARIAQLEALTADAGAVHTCGGGITLLAAPDMTPEPTPQEITAWLYEHRGDLPLHLLDLWRPSRVLEARAALVAERAGPPVEKPAVFLPDDGRWPVGSRVTVLLLRPEEASTT